MPDGFAELEGLLIRLRKEHEQLLVLIERKRQALAAAAPMVVAELCQRENSHVQTIGTLEKRRQVIVGQLTRQVHPAATRPATLRELAAAAPAGQARRLLGLQAVLRDLVMKVQRENRINRQATEGLLGHVRGVMDAVGQVLSQTKTYGRRGVPQGPAALASSFSITG